MSVRIGRLFVPAMFFAVLLFLIAGSASRTEAQSRDGSTSEDEQRISQLRDDGAQVKTHSETGKVRFIGTSPDNAIGRPQALSASDSAESVARAHLDNYGQVFGIEDEAQELRVKKEKEAEKGRSVVRFEQVHKDVPVLGGELNVQLDGSNNLLVANGEVLPGLDLDVDPEVDLREAQDTAIEKIAKDRELDAEDLGASEPELWIYDPTLLGGPGARVPRLVWRMDVTPNEEPIDFKELVLVDAKAGSVALNFNQIHTAKVRKTYTANNTRSLPGTLVCNESNPSCSGGDADAVKAHKLAAEVYDFYSTNHGRDSLNNAGMSLISTVHFGTNYQNAF